MASFLGASTPAFAAEILGNHLSLSLAARYSSSTPAAFKPMAMKKKAKPVAMTLTSKEQRFQNNHGLDSGMFLPNGDRDDIPEHLDNDRKVPDKYGGPAGFIMHKVREVHKAFSEIGPNIYDILEMVLWSSEILILDTGASCHACRNKKWFDTLVEIDYGGSVKLGDDTKCKIIGVGTVKVKMFDGIVRTLTNVLYVPTLKNNIISLCRLDLLGYSFESSRGELKVTKGSTVYMKGYLTFFNVYRLQGVVMVGGPAVSTQEDLKDTTQESLSSNRFDSKSRSLNKRSKKYASYWY